MESLKQLCKLLWSFNSIYKWGNWYKWTGNMKQWSNEASSAKPKDVTFPCQGSTGKPHIPQRAKIRFLSGMWDSEGTIIKRTRVVLGSISEFWRLWLAEDSWTCSKALLDQDHRVSPRWATPFGIRGERRGKMADQGLPRKSGLQPDHPILSLCLNLVPESVPAPLSSPFPGAPTAPPGCQSCTIPLTLPQGLSYTWDPPVH